MTRVALTNVTVLAVRPPIDTAAFIEKFTPSIVSKVPPAIGPVFGETEVINDNPGGGLYWPNTMTFPARCTVTGCVAGVAQPGTV